jgi:hypothetical protein
LRVYLHTGVGQNPETAFLNAAIDALDAWVETGSPPGALAGAKLEQPAFRRDDEKHDQDGGRRPTLGR